MSPRRSRIGAIARALARRAMVAGACLLAAGPAFAAGDWADVADLYRQARYDEARQAARRLGGTSPEAIFWSIRLATDPDAALETMRAALRRADVPRGLRARLALETAWIQFGRARYGAALAALDQARGFGGPGTGPDATLLAAMSLRALGQGPQARELLSGARKDDPAWLPVRCLAGRLALEAGAPADAWRIFAANGGAERLRREPELLAGARDALLALGRRDEADDLLRELQDRFPDALVTAQVGRGKALPSPSARPGKPAPAPEAVAAPSPPQASSPESPARVGAELPAGGFCLQFGAFTDRARAESFLADWEPRLAGLRIVETTGPTGRRLYKVRVGRWSQRPGAEAEAERLRRELGLHPLVIDAAR